ncbi:MAG TPA: hypothetical protein VLI04_19160 [Nocardioidaceae bacterium]|nr:hypothetical protein [Nocardioidaceae bacterium]
MEITARTIALAVLAASGLIVGAWATPFPRSFYDDFPGFGRAWVSPSGPYNEHLVRDVGAFYLALALVAVLALLWRDRRTTLLAGAAWATFSAPHLAYHLVHLDELETFDAIGQAVTLSGTLVLALWLAVSAAQEVKP